MTQFHQAIVGRQWLSLGLARRLLSINEATLRSWADQGLIRTYRTPGGHRRFAAEDIVSLTQGADRAPVQQLPVEVILPTIRRRLTNANHHINGLSQLDRKAQEHMRVLGRQLLELCLTAVGRTRHRTLIAEAHSLGERYAEASRRGGMGLPEVIEAFTYFRTLLLEALRPALLKRCGPDSRELSRCWQQVNRVTDEVLLRITRAAPPDHLQGSRHG